MGYAQRKFHFKHKLPNGDIYHGFINIEADTKEELYKKEEIKGDYYVKKVPEGWYGSFFLENNMPVDIRKKTSAKSCTDFVMTVGVRHEVKIGAPPKSMEEAEEKLKFLEPLEYEELPIFTGRLEDEIYSEETHFWE